MYYKLLSNTSEYYFKFSENNIVFIGEDNMAVYHGTVATLKVIPEDLEPITKDEFVKKFNDLINKTL